MSPKIWAALVLFVLGLAAAGYAVYSWQAGRTRPPAAEAPAAPPVAAAPAAEAPAPVQNPVPGAAPEAQMQAPAEAPADLARAFDESLASLADRSQIEQFVATDELVRRIVASVDSMTTDTVVMRVRAVKAIPGPFATQARDGEIVLDPANFARYGPFVRFVESIDTKRATALYVKFYSLFQGEYRAQGYPKRYFNDRLIVAIDDLLATPEVREPIRLVQPKVLYRYADPDLEARSAGQKAMIRMGPDNAQRLKAKLRALRGELARQPTRP